MRKCKVGQCYLEILQDNVSQNFDNFPFLSNFWLHQDGAPPHSARIITDYFNQTHANNWIGNRGRVVWPVCSPGLTPLEFFI